MSETHLSTSACKRTDRGLYVVGLLCLFGGASERDALWAEFQASASSSSNVNIREDKPKMVKVRVTHRFAGEEVMYVVAHVFLLTAFGASCSKGKLEINY